MSQSDKSGAHVKTAPVTALHQDAEEFPGGIAALARIIGRSPGVLHNKFSAWDDRYDLMDRESDALALAIRDTTGAMRYIEAKCAVFGGIFVPLPEGGCAADDDVLSDLLAVMGSLGDMARELTEARSDGVITADEFAAYELRARRVMARVQQSVATLRSQVHELPQVHGIRAAGL